MANAALKRNPYFNGEANQQNQQFASQSAAPNYSGYTQYGQTAQPGQYGQTPQYGQPQQYGQPAGQQFNPAAASPQALSHQFDLPSATPDQQGRMSYEDTIAKTAGLFGAVLAAAAVAWFFPALAIVGAIGSLVLSLVLAFAKTPKVGLIWLFAVAEGLLAGGLSSILEQIYPGVAFQAVLATFAVVATVLVLFSFGKVRSSPRLTKIFLVAIIGYAVFSLANFIGTLLTPDAGLFGWRSSVEIFGIPLGVVLGLFAVLLGAYMLVLDFEYIKNGVENGAPRAYGWIGAYSLVSTVIFIYVELLRLIAILRGNE